MMSDSNELLLREERKDKELEKMLTKAMEEISLFNLRPDDKGMDYDDEENDQADDPEELGVTNGIKFFDRDYFESSFTEEIIVQEFLRRKLPITNQLEDDATLDQILDCFSKHWRTAHTWKGPLYKAVIEFCFKLLGTSQSQISLHNISYCMTRILNNRKFSPLKLIAKLLPSLLKNMGGNVDSIVENESVSSEANESVSTEANESVTTETNESTDLNTHNLEDPDKTESQVGQGGEKAETDLSKSEKTQSKPQDAIEPMEIISTMEERLKLNFGESSNSDNSKSSFNVVANFKNILIVLQKVLCKEFEIKKHSSLSEERLDYIFILILKAAHDPLIRSSSILFIVKNCLQLILEKYTDDAYFLSVKVQDFVEQIYLFWEANTASFDHHLACSVLTELLPLSQRGQWLRSSLACLSIVCCLFEEEVEVRDVVTISFLANYCLTNINVIKLQNVNKIYSILLMIDAAIDKPLKEEGDKFHLSRLLELINAIQISVSSADSNKKKLDCLIKVLTMGWTRLLNPVTKQPMKQRSMDDFVNPDHSLY